MAEVEGLAYSEGYEDGYHVGLDEATDDDARESSLVPMFIGALSGALVTAGLFGIVIALT